MENVIPDDPQLDPPIMFDVGVMSYAGECQSTIVAKEAFLYVQCQCIVPTHMFAISFLKNKGSGPDSRSSQIFINYSAENSQWLGDNPWETPFGIVERGMDVVRNFYSYGDMPPWGKGPEQEKI